MCVYGVCLSISGMLYVCMWKLLDYIISYNIFYISLFIKDVSSFCVFIFVLYMGLSHVIIELWGVYDHLLWYIYGTLCITCVYIISYIFRVCVMGLYLHYLYILYLDGWDDIEMNRFRTPSWAFVLMWATQKWNRGSSSLTTPPSSLFFNQGGSRAGLGELSGNGETYRTYTYADLWRYH